MKRYAWDQWGYGMKRYVWDQWGLWNEEICMGSVGVME
jgi:hypothetical protein